MLTRIIGTPDYMASVPESVLLHLTGDESVPLRDCLLDYRELPALARVLTETMAKEAGPVAWAMDGAELTYLLLHVPYDVIRWRRVLVMREPEAGRLALATYNRTEPTFDRDATIMRGALDDGVMVARGEEVSIYVDHRLVTDAD